MKTKKITRKQAEQLLTNPTLLQKTEEANKIQKIAEQQEEMAVPQSPTWIITDSSSAFPSVDLK